MLNASQPPSAWKWNRTAMKMDLVLKKTKLQDMHIDAHAKAHQKNSFRSVRSSAWPSLFLYSMYVQVLFDNTSLVAVPKCQSTVGRAVNEALLNIFNTIILFATKRHYDMSRQYFICLLSIFRNEDRQVVYKHTLWVAQWMKCKGDFPNSTAHPIYGIHP